LNKTSSDLDCLSAYKHYHKLYPPNVAAIPNKRTSNENSFIL